ncbi:ATP-binding protein [Proteiniclasticum sp. C24MP]|uniref:HAMP domain-containing sensor histidine kinase n=1 Tax=Proteiniclasticum sp. C24MP TaxID=3374101 RepID=UPI003753FCC0
MKRLKLSTKITWNYAIIFTSILLIINLAVFLSTQFYNRLSAGNEVEVLLTSIENEIMEGTEVTGEKLRSLGAVSPFFVRMEEGDEITTSTTQFSIVERGDSYVLLKDFDKGREESDKLIVSRKRVAGPSGVVDLLVLKDLSVFSFMNSVTLVTLVIASILGIFVSYVVGYFISRQSFTPIISMTKSAAAIGPGNIHDRIEEPDVRDELKELSHTFNGLLDRLDDAYSKQAKFVSDASHELRTPLTVIKGYNDLLMRWGRDDAEILDEAIQAIRAETDNMSMLVENLLFIAKGENKKMKLDRTTFSLKALLKETAKDSELSVPDRDFEVLSDEFTVSQDRRMIKQLLRIFIENSVKFTGPDAKITLKAEDHEDFYRLHVIDDGEGIAEEDLHQVFERFYVADKARTKNKAGSGLGLSIAKWIVETHGGTLEAKSRLGEGTTMTATFPKNGEKNDSLEIPPDSDSSV